MVFDTHMHRNDKEEVRRRDKQQPGGHTSRGTSLSVKPSLRGQATEPHILSKRETPGHKTGLCRRGRSLKPSLLGIARTV